MFSLEEVKDAVPKSLRSSVTTSLVDKLNSLPEEGELIRQNFITYSKVLTDGKYKVSDYLSAVMYVSYKLMDCSNEEAYRKTFPDRYNSLLQKGLSRKDISAYVSAYNKGKLVNSILEQTMIPSWILHQDKYNKALNILEDIMVNGRSENVRMKAADSILTHLAKPEAVAPLININTEHTSINEIKELLVRVATRQQDTIRSGVPTKEVIQEKIVDAQYEEANS